MQLARRVRRCLEESSPGVAVESVQRLPGGASSLTYLVRLAGSRRNAARRIVVKTAPAGLEPKGHRDVLRQARLLKMLDRFKGVRVPEVLFTEAGAPPETQPLFAMRFMPGQSYEPHADVCRGSAPVPSEIRSRALQAVDMLAELHRVPVGEGEPTFEAEPEISLDAELQRWLAAMRTVPQYAEAEIERMAARLADTIPEPLPPALTHGDFRLGNMLCSGGDVNVVIDWELWALSDPRFDLGWMRFSANPQVNPLAIRVADGMLSPDDIAARYRKAAGRDVGDLAWFDAMTLFKKAAVIALIVKHRRRRSSMDQYTSRLAEAVPALLRHAEHAIGKL